jgi:hypothetical protein
MQSTRELGGRTSVRVSELRPGLPGTTESRLGLLGKLIVFRQSASFPLLPHSSLWRTFAQTK